MRKHKIISLLLIIVLSLFSLAACKTEDGKREKIKDLEFTVVEDADLPGELKEIIDKKKENPFRLTYSNANAGYLYIAVGFGQQNSGGYSIAVEELSLLSNVIYINTNLIGPSEDDMVSQGVTYPYIVVKLEFIDKRVEFD